MQLVIVQLALHDEASAISLEVNEMRQSAVFRRIESTVGVTKPVASDRYLTVRAPTAASIRCVERYYNQNRNVINVTTLGSWRALSRAG